MIIPKAGRLAAPQDLVPTTQDSTDTILLSSIDYAAPSDVWLVIDTETIATGDANDVFDFSLVVSQEEALTTNLEVLALRITGIADARLATAGNRILGVNLGKMLTQLADSDYDYVGLILGVTAGATLSVNIAISTTEPRTISHSQSVVSNVGVPTRVSAGS
jgi:hypothetical protein